MKDYFAIKDFTIQHNWSIPVLHQHNKNLFVPQTMPCTSRMIKMQNRNMIKLYLFYLRSIMLHTASHKCSVLNIPMLPFNCYIILCYISSLPTLHTKQSTCQSEFKAFTALSVIGFLHPVHFEHVKSI